MILLAFLAIAAVGGAAAFAAGRFGPRPGRTGGTPSLRDLAAVPGEPDPRLPPVLLPEHPDAADIADLRFSVALRGYRMDEVDEVLARLAQALLERDAALAQLRDPGAGIPSETGRHVLAEPGLPSERKDP
ncbi:DivIVA domain-containing protein [Arthrobacter gandavensis]|uniref:DivIVA domain-containing protein n=1 Tax=Arthrobacter gandavensis TaxID=169960 RepID=UPI00188E0F63|nr:DivIVA domain-containing protein [Arthrobacter gandavensis]MBF4993755.1 DivIVA domain-containing protein [Arthrobacter gandavensis]